MKQLLLFFTVSSIILSVMGGCKDTTTTPQNPCEGRKIPFKADFNIYEASWQAPDTLLVADTILNTNDGLFSANGNYTNYEWQIGTDSRTWKNKSVRMSFREFSGRITVRLIARDSNWSKCVPGDDGIDTVVKTFVVVHGLSASRIVGKFLGSNLDNLKDTFTVDFSMFREGYIHSTDTTGKIVMVNNLPKGASEPAPESPSALQVYCGIYTLPFYKGLFMDSRGHVGNNVNSMSGFARLSDDSQSITIRYSERNPNRTQPRIERVFIGRRVR